MPSCTAWLEPRRMNFTKFSRFRSSSVPPGSSTSSCRRRWFALRASSASALFHRAAGRQQFHIRWGVENGVARPVDIPLYEGVATRTLKKKDVFATEDASQTPGADLDFVKTFKIRQLLAVPLLGSNGDVLGMFGVLDRVEAGPINDEDVRRAQGVGCAGCDRPRTDPQSASVGRAPPPRRDAGQRSRLN